MEGSRRDSLEIESLEAGAVVLRLDVCNDLPLERWILSLGAHARVLAPSVIRAADQA